MSAEYIRTFLEILIAIVTVINWMSNRQRVTADAMTAMEKRLDEQLDGHSDRLARIEADMNNTPNHADLGEIYREMRKISETISEVNAGLSSNASTLKMLNEQVIRMDVYWRSK